jgi:CubicO group peptidase (beta-lactamase class C family)
MPAFVTKNLVVLTSIVLTLFGLVAVPTITNAQGSEPVLPEHMDSYLNALVESGFSGAVLVAKDREILLHEGCGPANDADQLAVTPDTVFLFGSITKQFTADGPNIVCRRSEVTQIDQMTPPMPQFR